MARLIEVLNNKMPSNITLNPGDVLSFRAGGGYVRQGSNVVELVGVFLPVLLQDTGTIVSPMGAPNTVLFLAKQPGWAQLSVVTGDPWHHPETHELAVAVSL